MLGRRAGPSLVANLECLQVQCSSVEEFGEATDEELWQASVCVAVKAHQFVQQVCVLFKKKMSNLS